MADPPTARDYVNVHRVLRWCVRRIVSTVGKTGAPGEQVRCVVSVAMLTEGWDANTVTQILGLRAFTSQLVERVRSIPRYRGSRTSFRTETSP